MMGRLPAEIDCETPASLWAAFQGFRTFHGAKDDDVSDEEFLQVLAAEQAAGRA